MGTKLTCENDYVEILEEKENSREFMSIKRYCGEDKPAVFVSARNQIKIHYMQTVNFAGTGWTLYFMGVNEGKFTQLYDFLTRLIFFRSYTVRLVKISMSSFSSIMLIAY